MSERLILPDEVGKTYAVQPGRGKKAIGRLRVRDVEMEPLSDALADYKAEGFFTADAFKAYWSKLYGGFDEGLAVWRIEFEVAVTSLSCDSESQGRSIS